MNVVVKGDFRGKLCDFGMSKVKTLASTTKATVGGGLKGTPAYSAPETIKSGTYSKQSDIFSLGILVVYAV